MKCQFCSAQIPEGDSFCGECGARAPGASATPGAQLEDTPSIPAAPVWRDQRLGESSAAAARPSSYVSDPAPGVQYAYGGFWLRLAAWLIDSVIALGVSLACAVAVAAAFGGLTGLWVMVFFILLYVPIAFTYFWIASAAGGGWGKRACGLRIVALDDSSVPGYGKAFVRVLVTGAFGVLGGFIPVVGFIATLIDPLSMLWDERKQTYHDKVAGTIVIRA